MSIRTPLLPPARTPTRRSINDVLSAGLARVFVTPRKRKTSASTALHTFESAFESASVGSPLGDGGTDEAAIVADLMHVLNQTLPEPGTHLEGGVDTLTKQTKNMGNAAEKQRRAEEIAKQINDYVTYMINANLTVDQVSRELGSLATSLGLKVEFVRHWVFQVRRDRAARGDQAARQAVVANHPRQPPPEITPFARGVIHDYVQSKRGGQRHNANEIRAEILAMAAQLQLPVRTVEYWIRANLTQPSQP